MTDKLPIERLENLAEHLGNRNAEFGCTFNYDDTLDAAEAIRELISIRKAQPAIRDALEIGLDAANDVLADYEQRYAGYRQARIDGAREEVEKIKSAILELDSQP